MANRFTRAAVVGNPRDLTQAEEGEQEIAEAGNRLIKNSIVCRNHLYLARRLERAGDEEAREDLRCIIATLSPMPQAHVNVFGNTTCPMTISEIPSESSPLKPGSLNQVWLWVTRKRRKSRYISSMPDSLWDFRDLCWDEPKCDMSTCCPSSSALGQGLEALH